MVVLNGFMDITKIRNRSRAIKMLMWPQTEHHPHRYPWWHIAWCAPFAALSIVLVYTAAILCALLALFYQPTRAAYIFNRVRNA